MSEKPIDLPEDTLEEIKRPAREMLPPLRSGHMRNFSSSKAEKPSPSPNVTDEKILPGDVHHMMMESSSINESSSNEENSSDGSSEGSEESSGAGMGESKSSEGSKSKESRGSRTPDDEDKSSKNEEQKEVKMKAKEMQGQKPDVPPEEFSSSADEDDAANIAFIKNIARDLPGDIATLAVRKGRKDVTLIVDSNTQVNHLGKLATIDDILPNQTIRYQTDANHNVLKMTIIAGVFEGFIEHLHFPPEKMMVLTARHEGLPKKKSLTNSSLIIKP